MFTTDRHGLRKWITIKKTQITFQFINNGSELPSNATGRQDC